MGSAPKGNFNTAGGPRIPKPTADAFYGMGSPTTTAKMTSAIQKNPVAYPTAMGSVTANKGAGYTMAGQDNGPALPALMPLPTLPAAAQPSGNDYGWSRVNPNSPTGNHPNQGKAGYIRNQQNAKHPDLTGKRYGGWRDHR